MRREPLIPKRLVLVLIYLIPIISLGISVLSAYYVYNTHENRAIIIQTSRLNEAEANVILAEAQATYTRAEDAVNSAGLILSFLEGFSVLAGVIVVGAGILGISSAQELREDTEAMKLEVIKRLEQAETELLQRVEQAELELLNRAQLLTQLEVQMEQTILESQERINQQILSATKNAERSFEALSHHVMAQKLTREHNIDAAIAACREARTLDPDNMPNNYLLGSLLVRKDELLEAIVYLTEAYHAAHADSEISSAPAQALLGLALRKQGDSIDELLQRNQVYNLAESHLIEATQNDPQLLTESSESYFGVLGSLYRRQGRTKDAIAAYERAIKVTPRRSYPEINLAMLYLQQGESAKADQHRKRAEGKARRRLEDTPDDYWAKHDLALAILLRGEPREAITMFDEALEITPDLMTLDSVMSRLVYLQEIKTTLSGVQEVLEHFHKVRQRFSTRSLTQELNAMQEF